MIPEAPSEDTAGDVLNFRYSAAPTDGGARDAGVREDYDPRWQLATKGEEHPEDGHNFPEAPRRPAWSGEKKAARAS